MAGAVLASTMPDLLRKGGGMGRFQAGAPTYPDILKVYFTMRDLRWFEKVIATALPDDVKQFNALSPAEKHMLLVPIKFFSVADAVINENIGLNFAAELEYYEIRWVYAEQVVAEVVHQKVYRMTLDAYLGDPDKVEQLLISAETTPCMKQKMDWAFRYANKDLPFAARNFAFGIMEGFFFQSSFCIIRWFESRQVLQALTLSNTYIARDEGMHCEFAALLYSKLRPDQRLSQQEAYDMMDAALLVEEAFVREAIPEPLGDMRAETMMQFVRNVANKVLVMYGYPKRYANAVACPWDWLARMNLDEKANFFERDSANYTQNSNTQVKRPRIQKEEGEDEADGDSSGSDC